MVFGACATEKICVVLTDSEGLEGWEGGDGGDGRGRVGMVGKVVKWGEIVLEMVEIGVDLVKFYVEIHENQEEMSFNCDKRACTLSAWRMCAVVKTNFEACVV